MALEKKSVDLAAELLTLCLADATDEIKNTYKSKYPTTHAWAQDLLSSGTAHGKMMEIIEAQKGDPTIKSSSLHAGPKTKQVKTDKACVIRSVNNNNISIIAKVLGAPQDHRAGLFLHKRVDDKVTQGEVLFDMYSETDHRLSEAYDSLEMFPLYKID